jgi:hypothetical protein
LTPAAKPVFCDSRIRRAEGNEETTRSALPSVDALSTTISSDPAGTDSSERLRNPRLFQQTTSVETVEDTKAHSSTTSTIEFAFARAGARKCVRFTAALRPWQSRRMRTCAALILLTLTSVTGIAGQAPAPSAPAAPAPNAPSAPHAPNAPVIIGDTK